MFTLLPQRVFPYRDMEPFLSVKREVVSHLQRETRGDFDSGPPSARPIPGPIGPPIGGLPRNRLASSATGGASPVSPRTPLKRHKGRVCGSLLWKLPRGWTEDAGNATGQLQRSSDLVRRDVVGVNFGEVKDTPYFSFCFYCSGEWGELLQMPSDRQRKSMLNMSYLQPDEAGSIKCGSVVFRYGAYSAGTRKTTRLCRYFRITTSVIG